MKKKVISIALVIALIAVIAAGSFAYFTDKDNATNTFTVGSVDIKLLEQQRGEKGLEDFKQNKNLMPIVGSAQGEKDEYGLPTKEAAKNYVDKIVTVENSGKSAAYVRAYFAIPSALDDGYDTFNAGLNILHFNFGNKVENGVITSTFGNEWIWKNASGTWKYFETTIGDVAYNVYYADYYKTLDAGETTEQFIQGVYLDKNVDMDAKGNYFVNARNDKDDYGNADLSILKGNVECPVFAVAVQADGFDSADEAVTAAFGANYNPWGGATTNWQK